MRRESFSRGVLIYVALVNLFQLINVLLADYDAIPTRTLGPLHVESKIIDPLAAINHLVTMPPAAIAVRVEGKKKLMPTT